MSGETLFLLSVVTSLYLTTLSSQSTLIYDLQEEIHRERKLRISEREGRIQMQKSQRIRQNQEMEEKGYRVKPIGYVESPFPDRRGTPRQPILGILD